MLKSKLLASTIIVTAAAAVAVAPASAAKLKLSGYYEAWLGVGGDGNSSNAVMNDFDLKHDSEINFDFKQKLKNGMTIGGRLELEAGVGNDSGDNKSTLTASDQWDESSIYVSGSFGKIQIGNNDPAASYVGSVKGVGPVGIVKSDASKWFGMSGKETIDNDNDAGMGDDQKITYFSPKMGAMSFAVSYQPDDSEGTLDDRDRNETDGIKDGVSAMVKYAGKAGKAKYSVAAGYSQVDNDGKTPDGWNVGVVVSQGATTVAAFMQEEDNGSGVKDNDMGASIKYKMNKSDTVSVQYGVAKNEATNGNDDETTIISAGYEKNMGGGVSFGASIFNADIDNDSNASNNMSETGVAAGFKIKF